MTTDAEYAAIFAARDPKTKTDDEVRAKLRHHDAQIVEANRRYGHENTRSARSMIDDAYIDAYPWQQEAKRRGITSSKLYDAMVKMSDQTLRTLYRQGVERASALFCDPKASSTLRSVCQRRGLLDE